MINKTTKYITLVLVSAIIIFAGLVLSSFAFSTMGFIPAIIILIISFALTIAIVLRFLTARIPTETFLEALANEGISLPRQVIVRDPKDKSLIYFNERGELIRTQYGAFFFYGHPFINPKKILIINNLTTKEVKMPLIVIDGRLEYHGKDLYVETSHPIYVRNDKMSYEEIKYRIAVDDMLQDMSDKMKQTFMANPRNIDRKTKPSEINEVLPDEV